LKIERTLTVRCPHRVSNEPDYYIVEIGGKQFSGIRARLLWWMTSVPVQMVRMGYWPMRVKGVEETNREVKDFCEVCESKDQKS